MRGSTATQASGTIVRVLNVTHRDFDIGDGFGVITVASGAAALETVKTHEFDVALLEVQLPDFDGVELCRRLRADPQTANMIVL
ncbi:MAG: response regulator, partial [Kofleriaceae bacterium]